MKIKNNNDLNKALSRLDEIWSAQLGDAHWEERRTLVEQIEQYEDQAVDIPPPSPIDAIVFRMEQEGLRNVDLVPYIGSASKVSEVLNGKRSLSKEMIRKLHTNLGIPLTSLLGVSDQIPKGFVQVQWVLPADVVDRIVNMAVSTETTEDQIAGNLLAMTVSAIEDSQKYAIITERRPDAKNDRSVVNITNLSKLPQIAQVA